MQKLIVILGTTASGKSSLAVKLALRLRSELTKKGYKGAEIISADSRQVYKGLSIGSNATTKKEMSGVRHHLIGFLPPQKALSAGKFQELAFEKISQIAKRKKLAFLVGGTGFYIQAVAENLALPKVKPDKKLRKELEKKTATQLFSILKKLDSKRAKNIDKNNPRRLIRAIEIASSKIKNPESKIFNPAKGGFDVLYLGVNKPPQKLKQEIAQRFLQWLEAGFFREVEKLIKLGLKRKNFKELGLHYWQAYLLLKKEISEKEFREKSLSSLWHYAKRQNTWFKKNKKIRWVKTEKQARHAGASGVARAEALIKKFLEK